MEPVARQELLYLNHAGTSWPKPESVLQAVADATQAPPDQWSRQFHESFECVAAFFHIDPARLVLTPSCTAALNLALTDQNWQPGDQIITSCFEHHALYRNLIKLRERGVETVQIPATNGALVDLDRLEQELQNRHTKLVAMTAACNVTGALLPFESIVDLAHQHDAKVLIDGAQVAGWLDLNLLDLEFDFFTFAGHKGPQAPWGIGGLYVAENSIMKCPTATCEIGSEKRSTFDSKPGYCDAGSVDLVALAGLAAGCRWLSSATRQNRLSEARNQTAELANLLRERSDLKLLHDFEMNQKMPTIAVSCGADNLEMAQRLKDDGIIASVGFQCAPQAHDHLGTSEHGVLRFSFGPSGGTHDLGRVVQVLG